MTNYVTRGGLGAAAYEVWVHSPKSGVSCVGFADQSSADSFFKRRWGTKVLLDVFGRELRADSGWNPYVLQIVRAAAKAANRCGIYDDFSDSREGIESLIGFCRDAGVKWVRAKFIMQLHRDGRALPRQQEIPQSEFTTLDEWCVFEPDGSYNAGRKSKPLVVSHPWWTHQHPDPGRQQLELLHHHLQTKEEVDANRPVFIDFCCVSQRVLGPGGEILVERTPTEWSCYKSSLKNMHVIFTHDYPEVLRLTADMPADLAERIGEGFTINDTPYDLRGWCSFEARIARMKTLLSDDLALSSESPKSKEKHVCLPEEFAAESYHLIFTNGHIDRNVVAELYRKVYMDRIFFLREIALEGLSAPEVCNLVQLLPTYVSLMTLTLISCELNDDALESLAVALQGGATTWPERCSQVNIYTDNSDNMVEEQAAQAARAFGGSTAAMTLARAGSQARVTFSIKWVSELSGAGFAHASPLGEQHEYHSSLSGKIP